jgi:hypothetical protein
MRFILKLIVAPIALALTVLTALFSFVLSVSGVFLSIASTLVFVAAVIQFFSGERVGAAVFLGAAFIVSPFGLPHFAGWLVEKLGDLSDALKDFIFG